ncbi:hypothetical protein JTF08_02860 [Micrococcaceae bacterium RIT802]|jgi:hypothetical protein|nr:hypothetical protein [Micrococcaceae bacterium RIT 802]
MGSAPAHRHPTGAPRPQTPASRRRVTATLLLVVPLALTACTGTDEPEPGQPGTTAPPASTQAPPSSSETSTGPTGSPTAPPLTGPLPSFTAEELAAAASEVAGDHPGSRVRTAEEISSLAESGRKLLDDMDVTPPKCAPFMDNQDATLPASAAIASVTIPGGTLESETSISLAAYPEPGDAAEAVSRTTGLLRSCGTFTLQLGSTEGTATLRGGKAHSDAETTASYWMDVAAGEQSVASYTVSGSDGAVVVSVTTRDDQEGDIVPEDVAATLDEALTALRTQ